MCDQEPVVKKLKLDSKANRPKRFQHQWFDDNPLWKTWVKEIPDNPYKFFCLACQATLVCGPWEIKKHSKSAYHLKNMKKLNPENYCSDLPSTSAEKINPGQLESQHVPEDFNFNERVQIAEIRLATFFVENNLPFSISSELLTLMKDFAKEPNILQAMSLGKTKLKHIVTNVVCHQETFRITEVLRENKFSVYEDETSDITNNKWLSLMVRYVEPKTLQVRCELLQMIHLNATDCSASKIFQAFENELLKKKISLRLIVGLSCDNASVMIGKTSSFKTKLLEKSPNLVTLPCVCHSSALAVKKACETIPQDYEHFLKSISTFINSSPKRTAIFNDLQNCFEDTCLNILKYAETRWLTRHKCIQRILERWDILEKFLMEQTSENVSSANNLLSIFQNPTTKAYLCFLKFVLDKFNAYNAKFQTSKSIIHELQPSSMELLRWFLKKFIKPDLLKYEEFGHVVRRTFNFSDRSNHLPLQEVDFGFECKDYLEELISQKTISIKEVDLIREDCLQFYIKASEQICDRLPFNDEFLYCVAVFDKKTALFERDREATVIQVLHVNNRLGNLVDNNEVRSEWKSLYEVDSSKKNEWSELSFDDMWTQISLYSTDEKNICFSNLRLLSSIVRTLPHSNAEAERAFSIIPDAKTRKRNKMSIETLNSICVIKYALRANNKSALTMAVTREHLARMTSEILYTKSSEQDSNFTLYDDAVF